MVNSPSSFAPAPPIGLDSAATELKALFEETCPLELPLDRPWVDPDIPAPPSHAEAVKPSSQFWGYSLLQGTLGIGAIVLTMGLGGLSGAIVAQLYPSFFPDFSPAFSPQLSPSNVARPPVLEQFFQSFAHPPQLYLQAYQWFRKPPSLSVNPATLNQWKPGELEAEIDRLLTASQTLETEIATLEKQLGVTLSPEHSPAEQLLALRQSLVSPATTTLPLQMTLPTDLLFEDGKTSLKPEATDLLQNLENSVRTALNVPPGTPLTLTIATHSDNVGNATQNLDLSFQRSRSLQVYLSQRLTMSATMPELVWSAVGYGATRPLADNSTESNRQRNRRVEITLDW